ncbi:substrate-binding and VWA domain-containing protein [Thermopolyspora sp. NPDC052614]|uniref:substrate-binding and VWA domain-containing protein n=1 Tax=Thermopolyspora sp. NPDC052614 TaxID=3155682 RepID=UPI0034359CFD
MTYSLFSEPVCEGRSQLIVVSAADIHPALQSIARRYESEHSCVSIETRIRPSADVAEDIVSMADRPDVWIPDSSVWVDLANLRSQDAGSGPDGVSQTTLLQPMLEKGRSIARSPVIVAAMETTVQKLRDGRDQTSWTMFIPGTPEHERMSKAVVRLPTPGRYAVGLAALSVIGAVADQRPDLAEAANEAVFQLRNSVVADERTLFEVFDDVKTKDPVVVASEQAVLAHNSADSDRPVTGVYPREGTLALDYPYVVTTTSAESRRLAEEFRRAIASPWGQQAIRNSGFRTPDGKGGPALSPANGLLTKEPPRIPPPDAATSLRGLLQARLLVADTRALLLLDISGSMDRKVPGTKQTRAQATVRLAEAGVRALPKGSDVGLWVFATKLGDGKDHRELVPLGPLEEKIDGRTHKQAVIDELRRLPRKTKGDTGLYDSVLAAFRAASQNPVPNKLTSIVVFTDGKNDDDDGISLKELLATLKREFVPTQPVTISLIGYGRGTDAEELHEIAAATNGVAKVAKNFDEAEQIFLSLIAKRACMTQEGCEEWRTGASLDS